MTTIMERVENLGLLETLAAPGRSPEIPAEADLYGWLVGSWNWMFSTTALTFRRSIFGAKPTSPGCSKDAPFRTPGSCPGVPTDEGIPTE
jgi:hypothetical protein